MANKVGTTLLALNELDQELAVILSQSTELESTKENLTAELNAVKGDLQLVEGKLKSASETKTTHETKLHDEQNKIVERRKALSDIGGAKAAKLVEREIDIAGRALQMLEEKVAHGVAEVTELEGKVTILREQAEQADAKLQEFMGGDAAKIDELKKEVSAIEKKKEKLLDNLEDRVRNLYKRIIARYPGGAVGTANKQSCRACYRALPSQTYNQIIAGNMTIQCPGCSRILVYVEETEK